MSAGVARIFGHDLRKQSTRRDDLKMITGVCISQKEQVLRVKIPFVSYTEGYRQALSRDSGDIARITYLTDRYNNAVRYALKSYPDTEHLLIIDHYYLPFTDEIQLLIRDYIQLDRVILGASIWYWAKKRILPWIAYYDTLSAPEFRGKSWRSLGSLPTGIISVSGVGACWIFPRELWERTNGFRIPTPPQAGSSRGLDTSGYEVLLDCNSRLWRTHDTNPAIPDFSMHERLANTTKHASRKVWRVIVSRGGSRDSSKDSGS
jgi:hypothetical protein